MAELINDESFTVLKDHDLQNFAYAIRLFLDPSKLGFYHKILYSFQGRMSKLLSIEQYAFLQCQARLAIIIMFWGCIIRIGVRIYRKRGYQFKVAATFVIMYYHTPGPKSIAKSENCHPPFTDRYLQSSTLLAQLEGNRRSLVVFPDKIAREEYLHLLRVPPAV